MEERSAMEETQMAQYNERVDIVSNEILDAVREVLVRQHVTHEEYQAALQWIDRLVKAGETRMFFDNFFERTVEQVTHAGLPGSVGTVQGPYYLPGAPMLTEPPYVIPMRPDEQGDPMVLYGEVLDLDGKPVPGALVDMLQAGNDGTYSGFVGDAPRTNLRAQLHSDADGRFQIRTIRPAPYQIPTSGPVGRYLEMIGRHAWRPAHFHLKLSAEGLAPLTTQLYFRGGDWLDGDGDVSGAVKDPLIVDVVEDKDEQVAQRYGIPVPFFSCSYTWQLRPAGS